MTEIGYRCFRNADPPQLVLLWNQCELGRGAVSNIDCDAIDLTVFAQPYFDARGLIVAVEGGRIVGFVHAGFAVSSGEAELDRRHGVICSLMVHPGHRRRGIGAALLAKAEEYLRSHGSETISAGPSPGCDPFYFGLYGGCQAAGFLESDPLIAPFLLRFGYTVDRRWQVFHRSLSDSRDPVGLRLMSLRMSTRLSVAQPAPARSWWWFCRYGRLDTIDLVLTAKSGGTSFAAATVVGLDHYSDRWRETRAVGLTDIVVPPDRRRKGYGQTLLVEACRMLRSDLASLVEVHVADDNAAGLGLLKSAGFTPVDAGACFVKRA